MGSALFSVLGRNLALVDAVEAPKLLQVTGGADQHDFIKLSGMYVLKSRSLLSGADAGANHRFLIFLVIGPLFLLFLEKYPVSLLISEIQPIAEMPQWQPPSGPAVPP